MRSTHTKLHRFDPYQHPKWLEYRNRQTPDTDTVRSEDEYYENQAYAVTRRQGYYFFDPPRRDSEMVRENEAFHQDVTGIRETQSLPIIPDGSYIPQIQTISPSPSAAGLPPSNIIHPARLKMIMEEETRSGPSTSRALSGPANVPSLIITQPDMPVVSRAATTADMNTLGEQARVQPRLASGAQRLLEGPPAMDRTLTPVNGLLTGAPNRTLQATHLTQTPLTQALAAKNPRVIERVLAALNQSMKSASGRCDQEEISRLTIERKAVRQVLRELNAKRNLNGGPGWIRMTRAAAPAIQSPPNGGGQANGNSTPASVSIERGPEEILIEVISQIGQSARKLAALEQILNVGNKSTAVEGLSMALVGTARELLMQAEEVTGYARSQERRMTGGQPVGGQRLLADDAAFPGYAAEYDSDGAIDE
ncbi:MAG: hypothetical protein Q9196_005706 [Gyalolechia fulgens]